MRIFDVAPGAFLTVCNLTIRGVHANGGTWQPGYGGLGVLNAGRLMLTEVAIRDNSLDNAPGGGTAIRNDPTGNTYISNSIISGNENSSGGGAGILNDGTLTIVSSSLTGNASHGAAVGAGLFNHGTATVQRSTLSANTANDAAGGGIFSTGPLTIESSSIIGNSAEGPPDGSGPFGGAGLFVAGGNTSINNTTIAQNHAAGFGPWGGGIRLAAGAYVLLTGSTLADNRALGLGNEHGGGIYNEGSVQIRNSIVARNTSEAGFGPDCYGALTSLGHNIIGDITDCTITLLSTDYHGDPKLGIFTDQIKAVDGSLQGNGQIPLLAGSPAIDRADYNACSTTDQLGYPRVDANLDGGHTCDIGAVEYAPVVNLWISQVFAPLTQRNTTPIPGFPAGTVTVTKTYKNVGRKISWPVFVLTSLSTNAVLLNGDPPNAGGVGARITANVGSDSVWTPGETMSVKWVFGLTNGSFASFTADAVGFPDYP